MLGDPKWEICGFDQHRNKPSAHQPSRNKVQGDPGASSRARAGDVSPSESAPSATIAVGVALGTLTNATSQGEPMTIHSKKRDLGSRSFGRIRTCTSGAARTCFEFGTAKPASGCSCTATHGLDSFVAEFQGRSRLNTQAQASPFVCLLPWYEILP